MPHGVPDAMTVAGLPFKILQMPGVTVVLFEEFHKYRQIHTDGRQLPVDPDPAWYGYSIGRWESETFVVETAGFKEGSWLDNDGHPHTEALRTTERFRRTDFGSMDAGGHDRRSEGVLTTLDVADHPFRPAARYGAARASLREQPGKLQSAAAATGAGTATRPRHQRRDENDENKTRDCHVRDLDGRIRAGAGSPFVRCRIRREQAGQR